MIKYTIASLLLAMSISANAQLVNGHVSMMGLSLGMTPSEMNQALINKGFELTSSPKFTSKAKFKGKLNGYDMWVEIMSDGKKTIHSITLRTYMHDETNNKRDFEYFKKWLIGQYGTPGESGYKMPEGFDYAKWTFSKTQDLTIKTTDNCYVVMQYLDDHKVKYVDLGTLLTHLDKNKVSKLDAKKEAEKVQSGINKAAEEISKVKQPAINADGTISLDALMEQQNVSSTKKTSSASTKKSTTSKKTSSKKKTAKKKATKKKTSKK